jgi:hypothetical protein
LSGDRSSDRIRLGIEPRMIVAQKHDWPRSCNSRVREMPYDRQYEIDGFRFLDVGLLHIERQIVIRSPTGSVQLRRHKRLVENQPAR